MKKKRKHQKLIDDYDTQKRKHLENLSTKMLEDDEKLRNFTSIQINDKFLDLF